MLSGDCVTELRTRWLPNISDAGLDRVIELLEKGSPLLVHGRFTSALPMGCLASHIGWHHPKVCHRSLDAGILWLTRIAQLNPATSHVIRIWDQNGSSDWPLREELSTFFRQERESRHQNDPAVVV